MMRRPAVLAGLKRHGEEALRQHHTPPRRYGTAFHLNPPVADVRELALKPAPDASGWDNFARLPNEDQQQLFRLDISDPYLAWLFAHLDQQPAQIISVPAGQAAQLALQGSGLSCAWLGPRSSLVLDDVITDADVAVRRVFVWQQEQSSLHYTALRGANHFITDGIRVELQGRAARTKLTHLTYATGASQSDCSASVYHRAAATVTDMQVRAVGAGRATTIYRGLIDVDRTAPGTKGFQAGRGLLLSRTATADIVPRLEIRTNDVRCSHGVTTTHLDELVLLYMRSRGLSEAMARQFAVLGFFASKCAIPPLLWKKLSHIVESDGPS